MPCINHLRIYAISHLWNLLVCESFPERLISLQLLLSPPILRSLHGRDLHVLLLPLRRGLAARRGLVLNVRGPECSADVRGHCREAFSELGKLTRWTGRTGEKDGYDGDQVQGHGDRAERSVGAPSFVNHFLLLLRIPSLELEVSLVVAGTRLQAIVA